MKKKLHLVSFDVPYPPNYGGVIDVFYKIKALHQLNVEIYLHCFEYGRGTQEELNNYCKEVFYYPRNSFFKSLLSSKPFIVKTRENDALVTRLKSITAPILFEGLHTTFSVLQETFPNQKIFIRAHNIEHRFYRGLAESEENLFKKAFFQQEAIKLKKYENILQKVNGIFTISPFEQAYFLKKYGKKAAYVPAFHNTTTKKHINSKSNLVLYHGNLQVSENVKAALFLIDVYNGSPFQLIIASSYQNKLVSSKIEACQNISFSVINKSQDLENLFKKAQVNALPTFQKTGIKLKLLNTLYQGKFIIANDAMIDDTGLEDLVEKATTKEEFLQKTSALFNQDFTQDITKKRIEKLLDFSPTQSAKKIIELIF